VRRKSGQSNIDANCPRSGHKVPRCTHRHLNATTLGSDGRATCLQQGVRWAGRSLYWKFAVSTFAVRRGEVVENGESSRSSSEVDPSLNWHNIEIGSMFAACCKTGEIGSPLLVHFPESVLLIPRREQGAGL
jgi:hypothetical protein